MFLKDVSLIEFEHMLPTLPIQNQFIIVFSTLIELIINKFLRMIPEALILFYEPNHIYKNKKYLLSLGHNFIGSSPDSEILLDDKNMPQKAAAFKLRNDMLTLIRLDDMITVIVESNLIPKKKVCLDKNIEYILVPDKQFQIGRWRGLFKIIAQEEAQMLKGVVNRHLFNWDAETKKDEIDIADIGNSLIDQIPKIKNHQNTSSKMLEMEDSTKIHNAQSQNIMAPTLILPEDYGDDVTQKLQQSDRDEEMPQTLQEESPNKSQKKFSASKQPQNKQGPNKSPSVRLVKTLEQEQDGMPATLQDSFDKKGSQKQIKSRAVNSSCISSAQTNSAILNQSLPNRQRQLQTSNTHPQVMNRSNQSMVRKTNSYEDILFGFGSSKNSFSELDHKPEGEEPDSLVRSFKPPEVPFLKHSSDKIQQKHKRQLQQEQNKNPQIKKMQQKTSRKQKRIAITGFKINDMQKYFMLKKNMRLIQNPDEEYDMLIISKQPKITKRLLQAIIKGVDIQTQAFLTGNNGQIFYQFLGIQWKEIMSKSNRSELYKDKKIFLSESLHSYREIIQLCGGAIVDALSKARGNVILFLGPEQVQIFKQYKNQKTKLIFNEPILQKSILLNKFPEVQVQDSFFK